MPCIIWVSNPSEKEKEILMAKKPTSSQLDGVEYRRAKTWQIALSQMTGAGQMAFYILLTSATYIGNLNFGILVAVTGVIITASRVFDGITDPLCAYVIERFDSKHGKIRIFMMAGWAVMSLSVILMCVIGPKLGLSGIAGILYFILCYAVYIIGYTLVGVSTSMTGNIMTNDPKQRPTLSVWSTVYSYLTPMILTIVLSSVVLPMAGTMVTDPVTGAVSFDYNSNYFAVASYVVMAVSFFFYALACIGITPYDKPENFAGVTVGGKEEKPSLKDMAALIRENKELQRYMVAACSDKLAQTIGSASVVSTMLFGIMVGSVMMSTILSAIAMLPSIIFAIIGARAAGKKGNKHVMVQWTWICIVLNAVYALFLLFAPLKQIGGLINGAQVSVAVAGAMALIFVLFNFANNASKMVVSVATNAMRMDIVDYELLRSGKYMPATVSATYSFVDKLISSFGTTIATAFVAIIGYTTTVPQPSDPLTWGVKICVVVLLVLFPILGWICTILAMKKSGLSKEKMVEIQKAIAEQKAAAQN